MEWVGYGNSHNSWEPEELLNCPEIVEKFKSTIAHKIIGVKIVEGEVWYLLKYKDNIQAENITWIMGRNHFAKFLVNFYESRLEWINVHELVDPVSLGGNHLEAEPVEITCKTMC